MDLALLPLLLAHLDLSSSKLIFALAAQTWTRAMEDIQATRAVP